MNERELDALVASRVLNQVVVWSSDPENAHYFDKARKKQEVPYFSTDDEQTSALEEFMADKGYEMRARKSLEDARERWYVAFVPNANCSALPSHGSSRGIAVCRAALSVVDGTNIKEARI